MTGLMLQYRKPGDNRVPQYLAGLVLFFVFSGVSYLSIPSLAFQYWDSLAYAYYVETSPLPVRWGNHPLGHLLQSIIYRTAANFGYTGRALVVLQLSNTLITGLAVALFFLLLVRRFAFNIVQSVGWAALLGSGYEILKTAGTADIYPISLVLLLYAWDRMLYAMDQPTSKRLIATGILIGIAGLAHQFSAILLGMFLVASSRWEKRSVTVTIVYALICTIAIGYVLLGFLATNSLQPSALLEWMTGYGGNPSFGRLIFLDRFEALLDSGLHSFIADATESTGQVIRRLLLIVVGVLLLLSVFYLSTGRLSNAPAVTACVATFILGVGFILWWDPEIEGKFWLLVYPFFIVLLAHGMLINRLKLIFPLVLASMTLTLNQLNELRHEHKTDHLFEDALQSWIDHTKRDDVLYESNRFTAHLVFWGDRPGAISAHILWHYENNNHDPYRPIVDVFNQAWSRGNTVWFAEGLNEFYSDELLSVVGASRTGLQELLNTYEHKGPVFEYLEYPEAVAKQVYHLLPKIQQKPDGHTL